MQLKLFLSNQEIKEIIKNITVQLKSILKNHEETLLIVVLKGSVFFFTDLYQELGLDINMRFIKVNSYVGDKQQNKLNLQSFIGEDLNEMIANKNIVIVEDIIDSGNTLNFLYEELEKYNFKTFSAVALFKRNNFKDSNPKIKHIIVGKEVQQDNFLVGYGLDYNQKYRHLRDVFNVVKD